jgi:hypothetical protein
MMDKLIDFVLKLVVGLIALNLAWCLVLELVRQHPFQMLMVLALVSTAAYFVRECRTSRANRSPHGGHERTPRMPRGWNE